MRADMRRLLKQKQKVKKMADSFVWMIYVGGVFAVGDKKIGFWKRIAWPVDMGSVIFLSMRNFLDSREK